MLLNPAPDSLAGCRLFDDPIPSVNLDIYEIHALFSSFRMRGTGRGDFRLHA
jgi:hypothetical protein